MESMTSQRAEVSEVNEVVSVVRTFTDTVERVGPEKFGQAAAQLRRDQLAWVIDRLDDARQSAADLLEELTEPVEQYGADLSVWHETLGDLGSAGDGLYVATRDIDPDYRRWDIVGEL